MSEPQADGAGTPSPFRITIFTLFPSWFDGVLGDSILGRAQERSLMEIRLVNFRDWTTDKHHTVDDAPFGGGGGMILKPEPLCAAMDATIGAPGSPSRPRVLLTSPAGRTLNQSIAAEFAALGNLAIICGHYEGLDQRIVDTRVDEEISLGDFVLTGGEIAAMAIVDAVSRLLPGVLGNDNSARDDSHATGLLEGPQYTRPAEFEGLGIPEILLSGHHANIAKWRLEEALRKTEQRRPDLHTAWIAAHPPKAKKRRRPRSAGTDMEPKP